MKTPEGPLHFQWSAIKREGRMGLGGRGSCRSADRDAPDGVGLGRSLVLPGVMAQVVAPCRESLSILRRGLQAPIRLAPGLAGTLGEPSVPGADRLRPERYSISSESIEDWDPCGYE